jgi:cell division topological specificity factor
MGLLALFRRTPTSANVAKERLRIIVAQERSARGGGPDYLPLLRRELLEVIRKYVNVDPDAISVNVEREEGQEVLELSVALPERKAAPAPTPTAP